MRKGRSALRVQRAAKIEHLVQIRDVSLCVVQEGPPDNQCGGFGHFGYGPWDAGWIIVFDQGGCVVVRLQDRLIERIIRIGVAGAKQKKQQWVNKRWQK